MEKYLLIIEKLTHHGNLMFKQEEWNNPVLATSILDFKKGKEVGSSNYIENSNNETIPYLRVGDLINQNNAINIIKDKLPPLADENDILISFDGAAGRVGIGLCGAFSSGIRKISIIESALTKGYVYFWAISKKTQSTIKEHAFGTTIEHAGKSLEYLMIDSNPCVINSELDVVYRKIVDYKKKIKILKAIKMQLLDFYF